MDKKDFMDKLRSALRQSFTQEEIVDILSDYEGFFLTGGAEDKSERQICAELGDPSEIAMELKTELRGKRLLMKKNLKLPVQIVLLLFFSFWHHSMMNIRGRYTFRDSVLWVISAAAALWFASGAAKELPKQSAKPYKQLLWVCHGALLFFAVGFFVFFRYSFDFGVQYSWQDPGSFGVLQSALLNPLFIGPFLSGLNKALMIASLLILAWSVYGFYRRSAQYFMVSCHALSVIAFLVAILRLMSDLSNLEAYYATMWMPGIVYGVSLAPAVVSALLIRARQRGTR